MTYDAQTAEPYGISAQEWENVKQRLLVAVDDIARHIATTSDPETLSDEDRAIINQATQLGRNVD